MDERLRATSPAGDEDGGRPADAPCRLPGSAAGARPRGDRRSITVPVTTKRKVTREIAVSQDHALICVSSDRYPQIDEQCRA